jgi:hypothetical protein
VESITDLIDALVNNDLDLFCNIVGNVIFFASKTDFGKLVSPSVVEL